MKTIVVYYSQTGNTRFAAEMISRELGADIAEIECEKPYNMDMWKAWDEAQEERKDWNLRALKNLPDISSYDTVIIGTPVWGHTLANPIFAFMRKSDFSGKRVYGFWTFYDHDEQCDADFKAESNGAYKTGLPLPRRLTGNRTEYEKSLKAFAKSIKNQENFMEYRTLSNGVKIPMLGFGVYQIPNHNDAVKAVSQAIETGYRLIDTAQGYMNEEAVGEAVKSSGIAREDIFITTKLWIQDFSFDGAISATERSLKRLGTPYIDLLLLHQPMGDYINAWKALEKLYADGKLRAIGMANCYPHVIADLCETFEVKPMVNQVEMHPFFQQPLNLETMNDYGVIPEAWAPFNEGKRNFFTDPTLTQIGSKYGKTAAQVALRWNIQRGVVVIPKTIHEERMKQNFAVFDFALSDDDMAQIAKMDIGHSEIVNHFDPKWVKALHGWRF